MGFVVPVQQQVFGKAKTVCVWYRHPPRQDGKIGAWISCISESCEVPERFLTSMLPGYPNTCIHCNRMVQMAEYLDGPLITLNAELKREIG